ncbi:DNA-directed RNA polymerase, beta subunit [Desulfatibacillum aliphaticivorans]|uniref:DNA-directed RNA polymerase subunit beta n=1 Tax=Desulfatibacillum aliphaticivorans TaxID=218208 RepID=RPOB_DESAL|nr:DNA-directed RNA polymerase subunit beta [Desulfatibacillum aliphaticivorans]B8FEU1.1 RecName: Full=DNA-directed RNA polymerase subunit beta; Short=RNAP subunit beta; AltName: Full=RNA polymerase subunit beta; AltName: Full=Transcriptase subunit beta [Desulfatibacillum aliphaticivorans]ACL03618.1 DNA-directed RNA polymerase, beta subunit [Desulfatibacillum aliphaticivorans]
MADRPLTQQRLRKSFGKIAKIVDIPNLIEMQRISYQRFLQMDVPPEKRETIGLQAVFHSVFPIRDFSGTASLEFVSYRFGEIKYSVEDCVHRGMTYEVPIRITVRLVVFDVDKEKGIQNIRDIKEQEIYFGTIPLMTEQGTFVINGTERVVVSQLHRSSGVFFDHDKGKSHASGKVIYTARIIPVRGSWIDMEIDPKDVLYIRIDRRRKFPATLLFKAFGYSTEDLLNYFYQTEKLTLTPKTLFKEFDAKTLRGQRASITVKMPDSDEVIVKKGRLFTQRAVKTMAQAGIEKVAILQEDLEDKVLARRVLDPKTGEVLYPANHEIDEATLEAMRDAGVQKFEILYSAPGTGGDSVRKALLLDKVESREEALVEIYRRLRPSNPSTVEVAKDFIDQLFFRPSHYDLSAVGRMKLNMRLGLDTPVEVKTLRREDILLTAKTLVDLKDSQGAVDDIDHLGNRRVRAVGELLENQYRIGLVRMERAIKERMSLQEIDALMPNDLINPKPVSAVVKEFFGTSQLSQFMDQTNPLSEVTHKRRLSALGPGGLTRERAGFEVRDVHPSHYGRICPIETPEGPNIGLIVSLSTYARVNEFGFVETPYRVVTEGQATKEIKYLSAMEEKDLPIAQANAPLDEEGFFINPTVSSRVEGELTIVKKEDVKLMDISPNQLVSVSSSMIPFLENDDANRALMGSNMQRQAVPLLATEAPLIGTGLERVVARDSGVTLVAKRDGKVVAVDASRIVLQHEDERKDRMDKQVTIYNLSKFTRSNQNTCFNQRPIVKLGQEVKAGDIIADGPATENGELALGRNVTVAFLPWGGYNFEDSILVSERLVRDGVFTSVHIEEFEVVSRDTKLGKEEITRDIPNVGEEALKNLDDSGIVRLGAEVRPGDILVGKITPKGETQLSPEEKLLRAIFGEKAGDVKDTSLRVPPGVEGVVVDAKVFARRGVEKDDRTRLIEDEEIAALEKDRDDELKIMEDTVRSKLITIVLGQEATAPVKKGKAVLIPKGQPITAEMLEDCPLAPLEALVLKDEDHSERVHELLEIYREQRESVQMSFEEQVNRYQKGDDLPPGVIKMVKIYVAMKRRLSVGDKMAGRHGNKGVVSCILPQEDLPYFENGTPVDMVLNPLGVPSRMNVGQILEIHLGRAAKSLGDQIEALLEEQKLDGLRQKMQEIFSSDADEVAGLTEQELLEVAGQYKRGVHMATPVFDGAKEDEITDLLSSAGVSPSGQAVLYDGRTGERFKGEITVGTMYMLKLHHLVDDKIHARSIGPYSLVTQQPLGGKAQFGGQRLGEMEVWAMEAYGAAYALQEFLTVKSDDMVGRTRMYEKIVKGQNVLEPGMPESFNVLVKELQSLGLEMSLIEEAK